MDLKKVEAAKVAAEFKVQQKESEHNLTVQKAVAVEQAEASKKMLKMLLMQQMQPALTGPSSSADTHQTPQGSTTPHPMQAFIDSL